MKNWKKMLIEEIDSSVPQLNNSVLEEPINLPEKTIPLKTESRKKNVKVQLFRGLLVSCTVIALTVIMSLGAIFGIGGIIPSAPSGDGGNGGGTGGNGGGTGGNGGGGVVPPAPTFTSAVMTVEINPRATFVVNENGVVTSVTALNEDADVVLSSTQTDSTISFGDSLKNKSVEVAVKNFIEKATQLGYLKLNEVDAVRISSCGDWEDTWLVNVESSVKNYFNDKNIKSVIINEEVAFDEFKHRCDVDDLDDLDDLAEYFEENEMFFTERELKGKSPKEVKDYYTETIVNGILKEEVLDFLEDVIEDYAELVETGFTDLEEVEEFCEEYGIDILNLATLDINEFVSLATGMCDGTVDINTVIDKIEEKFRVDFAEFIDIPDEIEDCIEKIHDAHKKNSHTREHNNKYDYEHGEREDFDYEDFVEDIKGEHGSLEDFWENHFRGHNPNMPPMEDGDNGGGQKPLPKPDDDDRDTCEDDDSEVDTEEDDDDIEEDVEDDENDIDEDDLDDDVEDEVEEN